MARGIDQSLLEPFPTVLEIPGASSSTEALHAFFVANLQQPSFVSRAVATPSDGGLSKVLLVFVFGMALEFYRAGFGGWTVGEKTFCCGAHLTTRDGVSYCSKCQTPSSSAFQSAQLRPDPPPTVEEDGTVVQEENASFLKFEEAVLAAFAGLGIDPLNSTLIAGELLIIAHNLVHSEL